MNLRFIKTVALFIFLTVNAFGQDTLNFFDYIYINYNTQDSAEAGLNNQKTRLLQLWGKQLAPHGDFRKASHSIINYAIKYDSIIGTRSTVNANWECLGPEGNSTTSTTYGEVGRMNRICFDPNYNGNDNKTIYAASSHGGLWRTTNDGDNWENVNTDVGIPISNIADIAISYQNQGTLFVATGLADAGFSVWAANRAQVNPVYTIGIYRSFNSGDTWEAINTGFLQSFIDNPGTCRKIIVNPNNEDELFVATSNGIFKTSNATSPTPTWTNVLSSITTSDYNFRNVVYKPNNTGTIYASGIDIYKSTDGGNTWNTITSNLFNLSTFDNQDIQRINIDVSNNEENSLFAYI